MALIPSLRNIATDPPRAPSLSAFADRLAMVPLIADPGARWHYGVGLDLLGAVIERASGQPFDDFLKDRLFDPLRSDERHIGNECVSPCISTLSPNYLK